MANSLDFYFDIVCPYAYLASTQMDALAARSGAALAWKPILLGGMLKSLWASGEPFTNANRALVGLRDVHRWADHWNVALQYPGGHPRRSVEAMRLLVAAGDELPRLARALFRAYWVEGRDMSDRTVLREIAGDAAVGRIDDPAVKEALHARTQEAIARGVFGVPTFFVGDEIFWGQDRLEFVEKALRRGEATR